MTLRPAAWRAIIFRLTSFRGLRIIGAFEDLIRMYKLSIQSFNEASHLD